MASDDSEKPMNHEHPQHAPDVQKLRTIGSVRRIRWTYDSQYKVEFRGDAHAHAPDELVEKANDLGFEEVGGPASRDRDSLLIRRAETEIEIE